MKRLLLVAVSLLTLAGCVSPQSQQRLTILDAQCQGGDRDACTAAMYQAQANQVEQATNANTALGVGALLVGAGLGAAVISNGGPYYGGGGYYHGGYRGGYRGGWHH